MTSILDVLRNKLSEVDLDSASEQLLPISNTDNVIGILGDEAQRINALAMDIFINNRLLLEEHARMTQHENLSPIETEEWVARARVNRILFTTLIGLFELAIQRQFPGVILHDLMLVRQGWILVWRDNMDECDTVFFGNFNGSETIH